MLIQVAYCSAATRLMNAEALADLLRVCRVKNAAAAISGMLLYHAGSFIQVLEGEEAAVLAVYKKILVDARHRSLIKLSQMPIAQRSFGEWGMGFSDTRALAADDYAAHRAFLDEPVDSAAWGDGRAAKWLLNFRELNRRSER